VTRRERPHRILIFPESPSLTFTVSLKGNAETVTVKDHAVTNCGECENTRKLKF
jgi:hypothetical protein